MNALDGGVGQPVGGDGEGHRGDEALEAEALRVDDRVTSDWGGCKGEAYQGDGRQGEAESTEPRKERETDKLTSQVSLGRGKGALDEDLSIVARLVFLLVCRRRERDQRETAS